jgi:hypothetical protein
MSANCTPNKQTNKQTPIQTDEPKAEGSSAQMRQQLEQRCNSSSCAKPLSEPHLQTAAKQMPLAPSCVQEEPAASKQSEDACANGRKDLNSGPALTDSDTEKTDKLPLADDNAKVRRTRFGLLEGHTSNGYQSPDLIVRRVSESHSSSKPEVRMNFAVEPGYGELSRPCKSHAFKWRNLLHWPASGAANNKPRQRVLSRRVTQQVTSDELKNCCEFSRSAANLAVLQRQESSFSGERQVNRKQLASSMTNLDAMDENVRERAVDCNELIKPQSKLSSIGADLIAAQKSLADAAAAKVRSDRLARLAFADACSAQLSKTASADPLTVETDELDLQALNISPDADFDNLDDRSEGCQRVFWRVSNPSNGVTKTKSNVAGCHLASAQQQKRPNSVGMSDSSPSNNGADSDNSIHTRDSNNSSNCAVTDGSEPTTGSHTSSQSSAFGILSRLLFSTNNRQSKQDSKLSRSVDKQQCEHLLSMAPCQVEHQAFNDDVDKAVATQQLTSRSRRPIVAQKSCDNLAGDDMSVRVDACSLATRSNAITVRAINDSQPTSDRTSVPHLNMGASLHESVHASNIRSAILAKTMNGLPHVHRTPDECLAAPYDGFRMDKPCNLYALDPVSYPMTLNQLCPSNSNGAQTLCEFAYQSNQMFRPAMFAGCENYASNLMPVSHLPRKQHCVSDQQDQTKSAISMQNCYANALLSASNFYAPVTSNQVINRRAQGSCCRDFDGAAQAYNTKCGNNTGSTNLTSMRASGGLQRPSSSLDAFLAPAVVGVTSKKQQVSPAANLTRV